MILLTGTTGKVGQHLVAELAKKNVKLRILARDPSKVAKYREIGAELVQGDLLDPATLPAAFAGVEKLFLLTDSNETSVEAQHNAVRAAKKAGVKHLVRLSAAGTDFDSPVRLARWHAITDAEIAASGIPFTILRPGFFMQNLFGSAPTIKDHGAFYGSVGEAKVAFIDARDIAAAAAAVLTGPGHENKTYDLTGGEAISNQELAALLTQAVGKPVKYVSLPGDAFAGNLVKAGLPAWYAKDLVTMQAYLATGAAAHVAPTLEQLIGRKPHTNAEFVETFASAFK